jgi:hypothetical protein
MLSYTISIKFNENNKYDVHYSAALISSDEKKNLNSNDLQYILRRTQYITSMDHPDLHNTKR